MTEQPYVETNKEKVLRCAYRRWWKGADITERMFSSWDKLSIPRKREYVRLAEADALPLTKEEWSELNAEWVYYHLGRKNELQDNDERLPFWGHLDLERQNSFRSLVIELGL